MANTGIEVLPDSFWEKVTKTEECWLWHGSKSTHGRGRFQLNGRREYVHKLVLRVAKGPSQDKSPHAIHTCNNYLCVNPEHLVWGFKTRSLQPQASVGKAWDNTPLAGLSKRFWDKVHYSPGCWEWAAGRDKDGYGRFRLGVKHEVASRLVCAAVNGGPSPGDLCLHSCDNPPCVNPDHLRWGTTLENAADMVSRGRASDICGEQAPNWKLSKLKVEAIRAIWATRRLKPAEIASVFEVSVATIYSITSGRSRARG